MSPFEEAVAEVVGVLIGSILRILFFAAFILGIAYIIVNHIL